LDIGCGTGAFLEVCEKEGWTVKGTEPDAGARAIAQKKIKSHIEIDFLEAFAEEKFDVITLWHVLEHVHQLNKAVEKINKC
jgi:2-polyprenyl-3-methyl-5-hydroxy-6-metoxy-1,4-benzoquinol methylase